jgi:hypothetical protein
MKLRDVHLSATLAAWTDKDAMTTMRGADAPDTSLRRIRVFSIAKQSVKGDGP